jgi:hypothetical protein
MLLLSALLSIQGSWVEKQIALYCALFFIGYVSIDEAASRSPFGGIFAGHSHDQGPELLRGTYQAVSSTHPSTNGQCNGPEFMAHALQRWCTGSGSGA